MVAPTDGFQRQAKQSTLDTNSTDYRRSVASTNPIRGYPLAIASRPSAPPAPSLNESTSRLGDPFLGPPSSSAKATTVSPSYKPLITPVCTASQRPSTPISVCFAATALESSPKGLTNLLNRKDWRRDINQSPPIVLRYVYGHRLLRRRATDRRSTDRPSSVPSKRKPPVFPARRPSWILTGHGSAADPA
ncbi:hypothetical protein CGCF413_v008892 [Colletotrichum fructicola]|nr:hypothetical protein CGCF413_v008892 [Colletotrichum fructicola]